MALDTNELYSESTRDGLPAIQPDQGPGAVLPRTFDGVAGGPTLPVGCPVYVDVTTGFLLKCDPSAAPAAAELEVYGFVYPAAVTLDATNEVIGTVMAKGSIDYSVVLAIQTAGDLDGTAQELEDMLRKPTLVDRGLHIDGLSKIGSTTDGL